MEKSYADPRKWTPTQVSDAITRLAMYGQILSASGRTEVSLSISDRQYYEGLATQTIDGLRQALIR